MKVGQAVSFIHLSLGSSIVRASHRSSEGCGFDSRLGLRNCFPENRAWRTFITHSNMIFIYLSTFSKLMVFIVLEMRLFILFTFRSLWVCGKWAVHCLAVMKTVIRQVTRPPDLTSAFRCPQEIPGIRNNYSRGVEVNSGIHLPGRENCFRIYLAKLFSHIFFETFYNFTGCRLVVHSSFVNKTFWNTFWVHLCLKK